MSWTSKIAAIRSSVFALGSSLICLHGFSATIGAEAVPDGADLMTRVENRPRGRDQLLYATWRLISKSGRERVRETRSYWLDLRGGDDSLRSKRLIVFDTPTPLEDTSFLVWSDGRIETDDRRWVYLPALRKVRRIAGRDRGKSFAGTDFNYEDLSDLHVDEESHTLLGQSEGEPTTYWLVSSIPRDSASPYSKRIRWVHPDHYTTDRIEFYDHHERLLKTLVVEWQRVDEIWAWQRLDMRNHKTGHATIVDIVGVEHGLGLDDEVFSQNRLRGGPPNIRGALPASQSPAGQTTENDDAIAGVAR